MKKTYKLVFLFVLALMLAISSCSTKAETPTVEPTATITPTVTPVPNPEWSYFTSDDTEDVKRLAFDRDGFLWVIGYGGVTRWDVEQGTYIEYTQNDGLGNAQREAILVDKNNVVWVAAEDGIYKFDSESWVSYPSPSPLGAGEFLEGAANDLWLCGTQGLFQFDGEEWTQHGVRNGLPSDTCYELAIDSDGNPWVIAAENKLSHFIGQWDNIDIIDYTNVDAIVDIRGEIHVAPDGDLWIAKTDRVIHIHVDQEAWDGIKITEGSGIINAFTLSSSGTPWVVHQFEGKNAFWVLDDLEFRPIMASGYENGLDMSFNMALADPDGAIWFMGEDVFIRTMQNEWTVYPDAHAAWNSFQNQGVFAEDGRLFFTAAEGILALGESDEDVTLYEKPIAGLISNEVDELQIDGDGNVYALLVLSLGWNRVQDVIQIFDGTSWMTLHESYEYKPNSKLPTRREAYQIMPVQDGLVYKFGPHMWASFTLNGTAIDWVNKRPEMEGYDDVTDFIKDDRGDIWLTHGWKAEAVSRWDGESWDVVEIDFTNIPLKEGKSYAGLYQAFLSPQGVLWFAVDEDDQWLVSYDDETETWTNYPPDSRWKDLFGITAYLIDDVQFNTEDMPVVLLVDKYHDKGTAVYEYLDGAWNPIEFGDAVINTIRYHRNILWIGTEKDGVYYRDDSGAGGWAQLNDMTWEGGTHVTLIAPGAENDLWITTQESINLLRDGTWTYFPQGEGGYIDVNWMAVAPDGAAWFGSDSQGIARYGMPW